MLRRRGKRRQETRTKQQLPKLEQVRTDLSEIRFDEASEQDIKWIANLEREYYGSQAVPYETMLLWWRTNPKGFYAIRRGGKSVGHATLLPLKPSAVQALVTGLKGEKDLRADDIFPPTERDEARDVYIESVIADTEGLCSAFLRTLRDRISTVANAKNIEFLYAYPATVPGQQFLERLNFEPIPRPGTTGDLPLMHAVRYKSLIAQIAAYRKIHREHKR
jgi:hypothetical protein